MKTRILLLVLFLVACSPKEPPKPAAEPSKPASAAPKPALTVSVVQPRTEDWPLTLDANGSIAAWQEAVVGAEVGGLKLTELLANVGDPVRRGQVLARLAPITVEVDLTQQRAVVLEAEATLADARANAERARTLEQSGAISAQQINQFLTAERTAEARVAAAQARLRSEEIRLNNTRVLAPDDGVISARAGMLGTVLQPGQELFRLIRKGRLEWRAEVIASELGRIAPKQSVAIEAANGTKMTGTVRIIGPTVDPQTRTALVYIDLPPDSNAKAGMFARGTFALGESRLLSVPQSAVLRREGFDYLFLLEPNNQVKQLKVELGRRAGDRVEIASALPADARVVVSGVGFLNDADPVRVESVGTPPGATPK